MWLFCIRGSKWPLCNCYCESPHEQKCTPSFEVFFVSRAQINDQFISKPQADNIQPKALRGNRISRKTRLPLDITRLSFLSISPKFTTKVLSESEAVRPKYSGLEQVRQIRASRNKSRQDRTPVCRDPTSLNLHLNSVRKSRLVNGCIRDRNGPSIS